MKLKQACYITTLALSGVFGASAANAAPIPSFGFTTDGGFDVDSATCSVSAGCNFNGGTEVGVTPSGTGGESILSWGTGSTGFGGNGQQSALQLIFGSSALGPVDFGSVFGAPAEVLPVLGFGPIITDGGWADISAAIHYNNVILSSGGSLTSVEVSTSFQLSGLPSGSTDIMVSLDETGNPIGGDVDDCGPDNLVGTVCDDVFTLTGGLPSFSFQVGPWAYDVSFRAVAFQDAVVVEMEGGNKIITGENGVSIVFNQAQITSRDVPAPGVLALLGTGLALVGWRRRSKAVA